MADWVVHVLLKGILKQNKTKKQIKLICRPYLAHLTSVFEPSIYTIFLISQIKECWSREIKLFFSIGVLNNTSSGVRHPMFYFCTT